MTKFTAEDRGAALVEIVISFWVVLTIVLGTVHIGEVMREANVVLEASRHGARTGGAIAGQPGTLSTSGQITSGATSAANAYLSASLLNPSDWNVSSSTSTAVEAGTTIFTVSVTVQAKTARGPVSIMRDMLNMRPKATSVFPREVI